MVAGQSTNLVSGPAARRAVRKREKDSTLVLVTLVESKSHQRLFYSVSGTASASIASPSLFVLEKAGINRAEAASRRGLDLPNSLLVDAKRSRWKRSATGGFVYQLVTGQAG